MLTFTTPDGQPLDPRDVNSSGLRLTDTQNVTRSRSRTPPWSESADSSCTIPWGDEELMKAESIRQKRLARDAAQAALDEALSHTTANPQNVSVPSSLTDLYQHVYGVTEEPRLRKGKVLTSSGQDLHLPSLKLPELNPVLRPMKQQKAIPSGSVSSNETNDLPKSPSGPRWRWVSDDQHPTGEWQTMSCASPCTLAAGQRQSPM